MAQRAVTVDEADILAADKRLEQQLEDELQRKAKEPAPMDAATQARLEQAEKEAKAARLEAAETKKAADAQANRLAALEACRTEQEAAATARKTAEDAETLRRAKVYAEATVPADRVEAEAKEVAALGRAAVDRLLAVTPAPSADPLLSAMRRESAAGQPKVHYARRDEEVPGAEQPTVALTVTDWTKYGAPSPLGHPTHTTQGVSR
jgi:hypothetical protein